MTQKLDDFISELGHGFNPLSISVCAPMTDEFPKIVVVRWKRYFNSARIMRRAFVASREELDAALETFDRIQNQNKNQN